MDVFRLRIELRCDPDLRKGRKEWFVPSCFVLSVIENVPGVTRSGTLGQHSWQPANVFRSPEIDWVVVAPCNFTFQILSRRCANRTDALSTAITMSNL